jgi:ElaB/YqjD/DUF883 family membrane-anchored ribosome-binding protein
MGEGPKDLRDDTGRFDAPRNDDLVGRGDPDVVGRSTPGAEPLTPTTGAYPYGSAPTGRSVADTGSTSTTRDAHASSDATDTTAGTAEIRAEIEQKRADISEKIDEITQRLSPGNLVSQATDSVKETARDTMNRVSGTATDTARRVAATASETASQVADSSRRVGRATAYQVREHPWSAGALLAGVGAAAWWMMSRRSSGVEEWDVDDYTEESLYYDDDDQFTTDRGNRFVNVVRDNPVPIALTTIGIGWWMWNQRAGGRRVTYGSGYSGSNFDSTWDTRSGYGAAGAEAGAYRRFDSDRGVWVGGEEGEATTDRVKHAVSDASERARDTLSNATDKARDTLSNATEKARETMDDVTVRTRDAANRAQRQIGQYRRQTKTQLQYWMDHNPLAVGAVAMAVGAAVGLALPETRREQELMGDARDRVVDNAKSMATTAVDRATEAAQNLVGTAKDASDTASTASSTAQDAISRASQAAKDTINKA